MERDSRRREVGMALLVLMMASSLPNTAECAAFQFQFSLSDFDLGKKFERLITGVKVWFGKADAWWVGMGRKLREATFRTKRHFDQWYSWLKRAIAAPFTTRNPYVRCVKAAWAECVVRNHGLAFASGLWCTWIVYVECDMSFYYGMKRSWGGHDPLYNEGRGVPPSRLYHHLRKGHPYGI